MDISHLSNAPGVEWVQWCGFCLKQEASGEVDITPAPGEAVSTYPICSECLIKLMSQHQVDIED